ncbi:hypothetical protein GCM10027051_08160 [Niabella terrae]
MSSIATSCAPSTEPKEAIILAGGLGTRLRSAVPDLPKCMAPVAGHPFLYYLINYLRMQGIERLIFSLGYKHEHILDWLEESYPTLDYEYVIEAEPLGTGGAVRLALQKAKSDQVFIANGDTLFGFDATALMQCHQQTGAACTLALKPMQDFDRYGVVTTNRQHRILRFEEKKFYTSGWINAGVYLLDKSRFLSHNFPERFSFEKDYLEARVAQGDFSGLSAENYFIDIGIPEDFQRAQSDFQQPSLDLTAIDDKWTLFLDRDGVINEDNPGGYITDAEAFRFTTGFPSGFAQLSQKFKYIIIITNQRGVGRGIIQPQDLEAMHRKLLEGVQTSGGRIDHIYFCTAVEDKAFCRKPNPGMALAASMDFPDIDFSKAVMVGNNLSDMSFGRNAGMHTVFVATTQAPLPLPDQRIDLQFSDLQAFCQAL